MLVKSLNSLQNLKALFKGIDYNLYSNYLEQIHLGSLELQSSRQDWRKQMFVIRLRLEAKPMIGMEKMNNNNVFSNMLNVKRMLPCNVYKQQFQSISQSNIPQVIFYFIIIMIYNLYVWHEILLLSNNNWYINLICSKIDDKFIKDKFSA